MLQRVSAFPATRPGAPHSGCMDSTEGPEQPGNLADIKHPEAGRGLDAVWERLHVKLERSVPGQLRNLPAEVGKEAVPAWRRVTEGEARWQVSLAVPARSCCSCRRRPVALVRPTWLLPVLEGLVAIGLITANPRRIDRQSVMLRYASVTLIALISLANAWSAGSSSGRS